MVPSRKIPGRKGRWNRGITQWQVGERWMTTNDISFLYDNRVGPVTITQRLLAGWDVERAATTQRRFHRRPPPIKETVSDECVQDLVSAFRASPAYTELQSWRPPRCTSCRSPDHARRACPEERTRRHVQRPAQQIGSTQRRKTDRLGWSRWEYLFPDGTWLTTEEVSLRYGDRVPGATIRKLLRQGHLNRLLRRLEEDH